jgi:hypothetical protein
MNVVTVTVGVSFIAIYEIAAVTRTENNESYMRECGMRTWNAHLKKGNTNAMLNLPRCSAIVW